MTATETTAYRPGSLSLRPEALEEVVALCGEDKPLEALYTLWCRILGVASLDDVQGNIDVTDYAINDPQTSQIFHAVRCDWGTEWGMELVDRGPTLQWAN